MAAVSLIKGVRIGVLARVSLTSLSAVCRRDVKNGVWLYYGLCVSGGEWCCGLQLSVMLPEPAHLPDLWSSSSLPIIHLTAVWSPGEYGRRNAGFNLKSVLFTRFQTPYDLIFFSWHRLKSNIALAEGYLPCIWEGSEGSDSEWYCISTCSEGKRTEVKGLVKADLLIGVIWS